MEKMTSGMMGDFNRRQIYHLIYRKQRISRIGIANELGLSLPTVNQKLKALEEEKLIERNGFFESTGGRKSIVYSCVSNARVAVGVHITVHYIRLVAVDLYGKILRRVQIAEDYEHSDYYYRRFGEHVNGFIRTLNMSAKKIMGVGIALVALLSKDRQSVSKSVLLGSSEATLADFSRWVDVPCQMFHDSEAAAMTEMWFSPGITDAMYLGLNYHLNGMLILNGKIHVGKEYTGGLVEHMTLHPGGNPCYCGKRGCFTTYCSGRVLFEDKEGACQEFFVRLGRGDGEITARWNEFMGQLAIAIGSLSAVLDCDIILGGLIGAFMTQEDVSSLQRMVREQFQYAPSTDFICLGYKDEDVCACGAALAYIREFMEEM